MAKHDMFGSVVMTDHQINRHDWACMIDNPEPPERVHNPNCPKCGEELDWTGWHYKCDECLRQYDPDLHEIVICWK
jgi:predicted RNA-binding Zn-ribbon protein involved in translation (DUF1610 family)